MITIIRMSMGDFDLGALVYMNETSSKIFWFMWIIIVLVTAVIFLNFIVAEAGASYEKISANIANYLQYEKIELINESEQMLYHSAEARKNDQKFPMFIIIREMEV